MTSRLLVFYVTVCVAYVYGHSAGDHASHESHDHEHTDEIHAVCRVRPASGDISGTIHLTQPKSGGPVTLDVDVSGFDPEEENPRHGFHGHFMVGEDCAVGGSHYNPRNVFHGAKDDNPDPNTEGPHRHVGDLGNLIQTDGVISTIITDDVITLMGEESMVGNSFVIHEGEDDLGRGGTAKSRSGGDAGPRMGCCVVELEEHSGSTSLHEMSALFISFVSLLFAFLL